ncbi:MAG: phosphonate C-P lyase system protein PhnG [Bryobacteraceae bacterium]|nr:phosphonate C-P lyase system protein PhnG [Bryobacteraceae bacterium]
MQANDPEGADIPRSKWSRCLSLLPPERLTEAARLLSDGWSVRDVEPVSSGLALIAIREGAKGEEFYLGEASFSVAHVILSREDGLAREDRVFAGGAALTGDRPVVARAAAICDAVLSNGLSGHDFARSLVREGAAIAAETDQRRAALLAQTQVDFSLMTELRDD